MKVKTSELIDPALDWAVAKCEEQPVYVVTNHTMTGKCLLDAELVDMDVDGPRDYWPSVNWTQGGLIIERECIQLTTIINQDLKEPGKWGAFLDDGEPYVHSLQVGDSPLVAAMRCYVASKLGDEIEVPDELMG